MIARALALLALLVVACGSSSSVTDVPIRIATLDDGSTRFFVTVQLGGARFEAMLDTGSTGLRVLPAASPPGTFDEVTSIAATETYHSGLKLDGVVAKGRFAIADQVSDEIDVMRIDRIGCTNASCPATGHEVTDFTFDGAPAILGVGMRYLASDDGIASPLAQLPDPSPFVISAGSYGNAEGVLRLGALEHRADFSTTPLPPVDDGVSLPNGTPAWNDRDVTACVDISSPAETVCAGAMFDSGDPPLDLELHSYEGARALVPPGSVVAVSIGADGALGSYGFLVGATPTPGVDEAVIDSNDGNDLINLGTQVFYQYDVAFDPRAGSIGLSRNRIIP